MIGSRRRVVVLTIVLSILVVFVLYLTNIKQVTPLAISVDDQSVRRLKQEEIRKRNIHNDLESVVQSRRRTETIKHPVVNSLVENGKTGQSATQLRSANDEGDQSVSQSIATVNISHPAAQSAVKDEKAAHSTTQSRNARQNIQSDVSSLTVREKQKQTTRTPEQTRDSENSKTKTAPKDAMSQDSRTNGDQTVVATQGAGKSCVDVGALLQRNEFSDVKVKGKYKPEVPALLTAQSSTVSDVVAKWWNHLQPFKPDLPFAEVTKQLFQLIPSENPFPHIPGQCRRCAVVGGSGNLIGTGYGSLIDSKDVIIRMNNAPVKGYEKDVGVKTTHHIVYPESARFYRGFRSSGKLVLLPFKLLDIEWLISTLTTHHISRGWTRVPTRLDLTGKDAMVIHPEFLYYARHTWYESQGRWPSAGALAIVWAIHICDEVDVFGFGRNRFGNFHHYYEKVERTGKDPFRQTGVHNADIEEQVRAALDKGGAIRFHPGT